MHFTRLTIATAILSLVNAVPVEVAGVESALQKRSGEAVHLINCGTGSSIVGVSCPQTIRIPT